MRLFSAFVLFACVAGASAQNNVAPVPSVIIICGTNTAAPITVIQTHAESFKVDYVKQQSVLTNFTITCMSVKSITTKKERDSVALILHDATVYRPDVPMGRKIIEMKTQAMFVAQLSLNIRKDELVQVNAEIMNADRLVERFKAIPEGKSAE